MIQKSSTLVGLVCGAIIGCGGEATPEPMSPEPMMPPETTSTMEPAAAPIVPGEERMAAPAAAPEPEPLSDSQIAAITDAANTGEIEQAKIAQKNAKHPRVKKFAATMLAHHSDAKQKQSKLLGKLDMTTSENPMSMQLTEESMAKLDELKTMKGEDFDRAYIAAQIEAHREVLNAFDTRLIPSAQNQELKASLQEFRPTLEAHLQEAQEIEQLLGGSTSPGMGTTPSPGMNPGTTSPTGR